MKLWKNKSDFHWQRKCKKQAEKFGAKSEYAEVFNMDLTGKLNRVETSSGIYIGKTVVIAKKVIIVHRRDTLRATKIYHDQLMKTENIEFRWNNAVKELIYGGRLTGVRLKDIVTGEEDIIECDGLFVSIGRKPTTDFLDNQNLNSELFILKYVRFQ